MVGGGGEDSICAAAVVPQGGSHPHQPAAAAAPGGGGANLVSGGGPAQFVQRLALPLPTERAVAPRRPRPGRWQPAAKHLCARASAVPGGRAHLCHQGCRQWRGCQRPRHRRHRRPQPASPPLGEGRGWCPAQPPVAVGHPRRRPLWRRAVGVDAAVDKIVETQGGAGVAGEAPGPTGKPTPQPPEYPRLLARPPARGCRPAAGPSRVAAPPLLTVALPMAPSATARIVTTTAAVSRGCT